MPGLAPSVKQQARTTGCNYEVKMGRTTTTLIEYDVKRCNIRHNDNTQDKTGTFGNGWEDAEMGNERWDIDLEFINYVDDPIDIGGSNRVWVVEKTVKGGYIERAYYLFNVTSDDVESNGDHRITATGRSVNRREGTPAPGTFVYPTRVKWVAA